jgi:nucleotide-binding universal stress UspA family protein
MPSGRAVEPAAPIHIKNILVPVDFSELSLKSLQYAVPLAQQYGAKLILLYVVEPLAYAPELPYGVPLPPDPEAQVRKDLEELCKCRIPAGVPVDLAVREDFASAGVVEAARSLCVDLIVITTHGRTGIKHLFMGSTVEKIVQRAPCPVLVLSEREHEFV